MRQPYVKIGEKEFMKLEIRRLGKLVSRLQSRICRLRRIASGLRQSQCPKFTNPEVQQASMNQAHMRTRMANRNYWSKNANS